MKENKKENYYADAISIYQNKLEDGIADLIIENIKGIYIDALTFTSEGVKNFVWGYKNTELNKPKTMKLFQLYLREIAVWNSDIIKEETDPILKSCPDMNKLLFNIVSNKVKILFLVETENKKSTDSENKKIDIHTDKPPIFLHNVFKSIAEKFYTYYELFDHLVEPSKLVKNYFQIRKIVCQSIESVILKMVPIGIGMSENSFNEPIQMGRSHSDQFDKPIKSNNNNNSIKSSSEKLVHVPVNVDDIETNQDASEKSEYDVEDYEQEDNQTNNENNEDNDDDIDDYDESQ